MEKPNHMDGIYRFYSDGELIHEERNALTLTGRAIIIKSLLGIVPGFANSIAYGIGDSVNTLGASSTLITNTALDFETGRARVLGNTFAIENNDDLLIYSAVIDDPFQSEIREVGLYPAVLDNASLGLDGSLLFNFDNVDTFTKMGSASAAYLVVSGSARIGSELYSLPQTDGVNGYLQYSTSDGSMNYIDRYTSQDTFRLAVANETTASTNVNFRFHTDTLNYYDIQFNVSSSGYFVLQKQKDSATITGNPSWSNITFVKIWQEAPEPVLLDGLRIDIGDYTVDSNYGMISRAVLASPIKKPASIPITVEYSLSLGFNYGVS